MNLANLLQPLTDAEKKAIIEKVKPIFEEKKALTQKVLGKYTQTSENLPK